MYRSLFVLFSAWRRWRELRTAPLKSKYDALARDCRQAIHDHVRRKEENIVNSNNLGKFYKCVNKKMSFKSGIGPLKRDNGDLVVGDSDKAELLSRYFKSVAYLLPMTIRFMMLSHVLTQTMH